ncbi:MAG: hypothetical protein A3C43_05245 [Candidatus Schekmanbacteria bacterium RIFCSPHIGHO2_02_FULL_38_11]|nr:MAG: hypothetical protein A2043_03290 [Candidatus Schekmanbacteria bacterium GWA2_38_9]OGL53189.1 MAG: hypothetical protein A3C43_05245 [Candidatus Schekmanbacteria bacterium RIFCSPHIGHO2_02_FULL_38_11]
MSLAIKIFAIFLLVVILSVTALYLLIPYFIDINQIKSTVAQGLEKSTNRKTSIDKITPSFVRGPGIKLEGLKIFEENGKDVFLSVDSLYITIRITSLFSGKFNPKNIIIKNPDIKIKRNENGEFNIKGIIEALKKIKRDPELLSKILLRNILIKKGKISFDDFFNLKKPFESQYEELEINIKNFSFVKPVSIFFLSNFQNEKGGTSSIEVKGMVEKIPMDFDPSKIKITARLEINSFNLIQFFHYYKNFSPFSNLDGITNIKAELSGNLLGNFTLKGDVQFKSLLVAYPKFYTKPLQSNSGNLRFDMKSDKDSVNIKDYQIKMDNLILNGSFYLKNLKAEDKSINLNISSNSFPYDEYKKYLPEKVMPQSVISFLKEKLKGGETKLNSLRFEGKTEDFKNHKYPENPNLITLDADVNNVDMLLRNNLSPIKIVKGNISMKDGELIFANLNGTFGKSPLQLTSGKILSIYKSPELILNLKGNTRIYEITEFFKAGFMPKSVSAEARKIQSSNGFANLNLSIGKLLKENSPFSYSGELVLNGGSFLYQKLNFPFYNLNGIVKFNSDEININNLAAKIKDSRITLKGTIKDYRKNSSSVSLSFNGNISSAVIKPFFGKNSEKIKPDGFLELSIKAKGKTISPNLIGKIDLSEMGYKIGEGFSKQKFHPNELSIEGHLFEKNTLHIDKSTIILGTNELTATGDIYDFKSPSLSISLKSKGFDLKEAQQSFPFLFRHDTTGKLAGEIKILGKVSDVKELKLSPNFGLEDVTFKIGKFRETLNKIDGNITFDKDSLSLSNTDITIGKSRLILNGRISNFKTPKMDFDIKSPSLNLNDFFTKETADKDKREGFKFSNLELSDLAGRLDYNNGLVSIENLKSKCWDGNIILNGMFDFSRKNEYRFQFSNETKNNDIKKILGYLGIKDSDMRGKIDIKGNLGSLGENGEEIKNNLNGNISIDSKNGKIKKTGLNIFSKVLTFFNVFKWHEFWIKDVQVNGMPYKNLTGDFLIKNGIVSTENLFLDGNAMKISAIGSIDIPKGTIDMKLGVQPLSTVDTIVSNIPVIGYILGGENKSIVIAHFKVTGDLKNPDVESIPIQSLGTGILGIFKRIFTYPKYLISP